MNPGGTATHLLDERDTTRETDFMGRLRYVAEWFPFEATVTKEGDYWGWRLSLMGSEKSVAMGGEGAWSAACEALAQAKRRALTQLCEQLGELEAE